jgi:DNA-binding MarR family transcriptional regulator
MAKDAKTIRSLLRALHKAIDDLLACEAAQDVSEVIATPATNLADSVFFKQRRASRTIEPEYAALARKMFLERRERDAIFSAPGLFGEPAWDILLELMIARENDTKLSVSALTIRPDTAASTCLRYLTVLQRLGLIDRSRDPNDARRTWVRLSDKGHRLMTRFFDLASGLYGSSDQGRAIRLPPIAAA